MKIHSPTISTIVQSSDCLISFDTGYEFHYILQYVIHGYSWLLPILEFGCAKMIDYHKRSRLERFYTYYVKIVVSY